MNLWQQYEGQLQTSTIAFKLQPRKAFKKDYNSNAFPLIFYSYAICTIFMHLINRREIVIASFFDEILPKSLVFCIFHTIAESTKLSNVCCKLLTRRRYLLQNVDNGSIYSLDGKYIRFHYYIDLWHKSKEPCESQHAELCCILKITILRHQRDEYLVL